MIEKLYVLCVFKDYLPQYISIGGTLLGTLVGWLLRYITDSAGRINVTVEKIHFQKSRNKELAYLIKLFGYNDSLKTRHIKNITVQFCKNSEILIESISREKNDGCNFIGISSKPVPTTISVTPFNAFDLYICDIIEGNLDELLNVNKIILKYQDEKGKIGKKIIDKNFKIENVNIYKDGERFT